MKTAGISDMEDEMHQDEGHYAGKHPDKSALNERIAEVLKAEAENGRLSCTAAHRIASELGVSPAETGRNMDLLEIRITGCQLGLFGKDKDEVDKTLPSEDDVDVLKEIIEEDSRNGGISCRTLWTAAEKAGSTKAQAAAVCDLMSIKIHSCQLGAF